jgi:hypothetical protein
MNCFVLIENTLIGCAASSNVTSVTLDQQYAYNWLHDEVNEFVSRMVKVVPFYEVAP